LRRNSLHLQVQGLGIRSTESQPCGARSIFFCEPHGQQSGCNGSRSCPHCYPSFYAGAHGKIFPEWCAKTHPWFEVNQYYVRTAEGIRMVGENALNFNTVWNQNPTVWNQHPPSLPFHLHERIRRAVRSNLNKACPSNVLNISERLAKIHMESVSDLETLISAFLDKALAEPQYCQTYADLVLPSTGADSGVPTGA